MSGFYITKVSAFRNGYCESSIQLKDGLNIIYGPSNTGKTLILRFIDYIFGAEIDPESDYEIEKVIMEIKSRDEGTAILSREISQRKINVSNSSIKNLENGEYTLKGKNSINNIFLSLINLDSSVKVFTNQDYSKQQSLTWRALKDFFFLEETKITTNSVFFATEGFYNSTATFGYLQYLLTGEEREKPENAGDSIHSTKQRGVIEYINQELDDLTNQEEALRNELKATENTDIEKIIKEKNNLLNIAMQKLDESIEIGLISDKEYVQNQNEVFELELLLDRLYELESQYLSDTERLKFIINGEQVRKKLSQTIQCPYCAGPLKPKNHKTYIITETLELKKINQNLQELRDTIQYNKGQKDSLISVTKEISERREKINKLILDIQEEINEITLSISEFEKLLKLSSQLEVIQNLIEEKNEKIKELEESIAETKVSTFDIKSEFEDSFFDEISKLIDGVIKTTDFENYKNIKIDRKSFDLVINNNRLKMNQGKGYRGFLNSLYANKLGVYLAQHGKYNLGLLILDSPLLSLKEVPKDEDSSDLMKKALIKSFIDDSAKKQIIIAENAIPEMDYSNVNLIEFTKEQGYGRCGFIIDSNESD